MAKLIAVVGPDASGKTTLASALAAELGVEVATNPLPDLLQRTGYPTLFEWARNGGDWERLVSAQVTAEQGLQSAVIDGGSLDLLLYTMRWAWNQLSPDRFEVLHEQVLGSLRRTTHVLVMPPVIVAPFAGHRFRNLPHAHQLHRLARGLLSTAAQDGALPSTRVQVLAPGDAGALEAQSLAALR